jgi:pyruvate/2-oxoglutarate dehydrogenase complex dihydrolipoamide dehydrogenase (E3) component
MGNRKEVEILRGSNIKQVEDEAGRPRVVFNEPEFTTRAFDRVMYAMGRHHADKFSADFGNHY